MTCADARLLIPFRRTGDLLPEDVAGLDVHLATCPDCSAFAVPGAADVALRKAFGDVTIPAGLKERVGRAVAREQSLQVVRRVAPHILDAGLVQAQGVA